jgi:hypothetical protein
VRILTVIPGPAKPETRNLGVVFSYLGIPGSRWRVPRNDRERYVPAFTCAMACAINSSIFTRIC